MVIIFYYFIVTNLFEAFDGDRLFKTTVKHARFHDFDDFVYDEIRFVVLNWISVGYKILFKIFDILSTPKYEGLES